MCRYAFSTLLCLLFLSQALAQQSRTATTNEVPDTCPVTKPYQTSLFVPPFPYPKKPSFPDGFWFGTDKLWTSLPKDGAWRGLRGYTPNDPTFRQKLFYWRQGYGRTDHQPGLTVTGRRLDSPAPPLQVDKPNSGWVDSDQAMMVAGVNFPTLGCWEITGRYKDDELTFVVWVAK